MNLIIESIDGGDPRDVSVGDLLKDFQRRVSQFYNVMPVMSDRAYEVIEYNDGTRATAQHVTFGYITEGAMTPQLVTILLKQLWADLTAMWPIGTVVIWRRLPEAEQTYEEMECPTCKHVTRDIPKTKVTFRLGSSAFRQTKPVWNDGEPLPILRTLK